MKFSSILQLRFVIFSLVLFVSYDQQVHPAAHAQGMGLCIDQDTPAIDDMYDVVSCLPPELWQEHFFHYCDEMTLASLKCVNEYLRTNVITYASRLAHSDDLRRERNNCGQDGNLKPLSLKDLWTFSSIEDIYFSTEQIVPNQPWGWTGNTSNLIHALDQRYLVKNDIDHKRLPYDRLASLEYEIDRNKKRIEDSKSKSLEEQLSPLLMFLELSNIIVDLTVNFTGNVDIEHVFPKLIPQCEKIKNLVLSGFELNSIQPHLSLFKHCCNLKTLHLGITEDASLVILDSVIEMTNWLIVNVSSLDKIYIDVPAFNEINEDLLNKISTLFQNTETKVIITPSKGRDWYTIGNTFFKRFLSEKREQDFYLADFYLHGAVQAGNPFALRMLAYAHNDLGYVNDDAYSDTLHPKIELYQNEPGNSKKTKVLADHNKFLASVAKFRKLRKPSDQTDEQFLEHVENLIIDELSDLIKRVKDDGDLYASLGWCHEHLRNNQKDAIKYYEKGCRLERPMSYYLLGRLYNRGSNENLDFRGKALSYFEKAANSNVPRFQYAYARFLQENPVIRNGQQTMIGLYEAAAEKGHVGSMIALGHLFKDNRNKKPANSYFEKAAKTGNFRGQCEYGIFCWKKGDVVNALDFLSKAANQDDFKALLWLAKIYLELSSKNSGPRHSLDRAECYARKAIRFKKLYSGSVSTLDEEACLARIHFQQAGLLMNDNAISALVLLSECKSATAGIIETLKQLKKSSQKSLRTLGEATALHESIVQRLNEAKDMTADS